MGFLGAENSGLALRVESLESLGESLLQLVLKELTSSLLPFLICQQDLVIRPYIPAKRQNNTQNVLCREQ